MDAKQKREVHRALGRYVETFSHLVFQMRWLATARITMPGYDMRLGDITFGQATAQPLADVFFGMCRYLGNLDPAEDNVANQLQNEVGEKITERNKIMHGDWWTTPGSSPPDEPGGAQLVRFYPQDRKGNYEKVEIYPPDRLDALSDRIFDLRVLLSDFGRCALGLAMMRADGRTAANPGEYRVSDILVAENTPRSGKGGTVARKGPRADEIAEGPVYS